MPFGTCTATTDVLCHACTDASHAPLATVNPLAQNPFADCVAGDPLCLESIDVLVFYDHTALADFGGDVDALHGWVQNALRFANEANDNSLFSPQQRYRLAGLRPFDRSPRQDSISTMVQLRFNQYYQSIRRSTGADVSYFLIGNLTFGNGQTYYMFSGLDYPERAVIVVKSGFTAHPNQCGSNRNRTITAHELGHINGAAHNRAIGGGNGTGSAYAYHNQEPFYRRNEAFGLEVSQHGEQFYTLMSYPSYRSGPEYNSRANCPPPCKRIAAFASPELWHFLNPRDPLYGYCLVVQTNNDQTVRLSCQTRQPWSEINGSYVLDPAQMVDLPTQELLNRAVPLGRDTPSFVHPETQELIVDTTSTRSRDKVIETWPRRAAAAMPLDPRCNQQCGQANRITCSAGENVCGSCLPGHFEFSDTCYPRVETHAENPLHDEHYIPSGVFAAPNSAHSSIIELAAPSDLIAVEVYLHTTNAEGAFDDGWAQGPENGVGFTFGLSAAPAHRISVWGVHPDNSETLIGNQDTDGVVARDSNGQHDHALTYLFHLPAWRENLVRIRVEVASESQEYGFGINEVRSFGRQR